MRPVLVDIRKKSYKMKVCEVRMERLDYTVFLRCLYVRVNRLKLVQKAVSVNIRRMKSEDLERRVSSGNCTENKNKSSLKKVKKQALHDITGQLQYHIPHTTYHIPYHIPYHTTYHMSISIYPYMDMDMDMDVDMDMDMDIDVYHRPNLELACNVGSRLFYK